MFKCYKLNCHLKQTMNSNNLKLHYVYRDYDLNDDGTVKAYKLEENELKLSNRRHPKRLNTYAKYTFIL